MSLERRTVHFRGHVQGVGFRYTTCRIAQRYSVVGTVANLPDGSVRLIAEGLSVELDRFVESISTDMSGHIRGSSSEISQPLGEFEGFTIAYH